MNSLVINNHLSKTAPLATAFCLPCADFSLSLHKERMKDYADVEIDYSVGLDDEAIAKIRQLHTQGFNDQVWRDMQSAILMEYAHWLLSKGHFKHSLASSDSAVAHTAELFFSSNQDPDRVVINVEAGFMPSIDQLAQKFTGFKQRLASMAKERFGAGGETADIDPNILCNQDTQSTTYANTAYASLVFELWCLCELSFDDVADMDAAFFEGCSDGFFSQLYWQCHPKADEVFKFFV